jgi:hypothetical protein
MQVGSKLLQTGRAIVALAALGIAASGLVPGAVARPEATRQRIAIEESWPSCEKYRGTFQVIPLTSGRVVAGTGPFTGNTRLHRHAVRDGQTVSTFRSVHVLTAKVGTLRIHTELELSSAGSGYQAGPITWSLRGGSGAYAEVVGVGRGTFVCTPAGAGTLRLEGFVK